MKLNRAANKTKSNKLGKYSFAATLTSSILALSLTASTCGTFAWFLYATRAHITYDGITIGMGTLQVGFVSETKLYKPENYEVAEDTSIEGQTIYWLNKNMSVTAIRKLLDINGYANMYVKPVTSGKYKPGDDFSLSRAPRHNADYIGSPDKEALKEDYIKLPLVFRYEDDLEVGSYIPNTEVFLKTNRVVSSSNSAEAFRFFTDDKQGHTYLLNPTAAVDGKDDVGGILDLDVDGYYDSYEFNGQKYETFYGEFKDNNEIHSSELTDVDSVVPAEELSTYKAKHKAGVYAADMEHSIPETASYIAGTKANQHQFAVTTTNTATNNYGYLDLYIYMEGWDLSVVDREIFSEFSIDLAFEVTIN